MGNRRCSKLSAVGRIFLRQLGYKKKSVECYFPRKSHTAGKESSKPPPYLYIVENTVGSTNTMPNCIPFLDTMTSTLVTPSKAKNCQQLIRIEQGKH